MNSSAQPIIRVEHFTAAYGKVVIIDDVSFHVNRGEVFCILGGSGSGKSTILKHMIGLFPPTSGQIHIDGGDIGTAMGDERQRILRKFGVTYQSGALFGSMTLLQNTRLALEEFTRLPHEAMDLIALMKLDLVGLREFADYLPSEVSGGMQKRAAIARAMALDPVILFLDEPSAGLDPVTSADIDRLILRLARDFGITFVVVTHELASVYSIADRVIMIDKRSKKIVAEGPPAKLRDDSPDAWVRKFFNPGNGDPTRESGVDKP